MKHIALYQNHEFDGGYTFRCIVTVNHTNDRMYDISEYSAKRLVEYMYDKDIQANVSMVGLVVAIHYWVEN